jgi:flagellar biogenesis protein FliO
MSSHKLVIPAIKFLLAEVGERESIRLLSAHGEQMVEGVQIDHIENIKLALTEIEIEHRKAAQRLKSTSAYVSRLGEVLDDE